MTSMYTCVHARAHTHILSLSLSLSLPPSLPLAQDLSTYRIWIGCSLVVGAMPSSIMTRSETSRVSLCPSSSSLCISDSSEIMVAKGDHNHLCIPHVSARARTFRRCCSRKWQIWSGLLLAIFSAYPRCKVCSQCLFLPLSLSASLNHGCIQSWLTTTC